MASYGNPALDPSHPLTARLHRLANPELSEYDERPDPKRPEQQGVLFRREAPARDQNERRHIAIDRWGEERDTRREKGRATGMVPEDGILYHGTSSRLRTGSVIVPGHQPNFEVYGNGRGASGQEYGRSHDTNREHAFATPHLHEAYRYAKTSQDVQAYQRGTKRGAYVYEVRPVGPVQIDHEDADARAGYSDYADAFQTRHGYRVLGRVPHAHAQEAYRDYMEGELGEQPGEYPFAPKTRGWDL